MATAVKTLERLPRQGKIFGVCAGLADYFGVDVTSMRVIFVVLAFATGGAMVILYIVLAIVMPVASETDGARSSSGADVTVGDKVQKLGKELQDNRGMSRVRNYLGIGLLVFGIWLLLGQFFPEWASFRWEIVWPAVLILSGLFIITKRK
jgi:phage shock protein PspC (stress-responsive transcriptional regulator)